jgi:hypothetical protein
MQTTSAASADHRWDRHEAADFNDFDAGPAASAAVMTAAVSREPVVDEDDREWTIALAKARAVPTAARVVSPALPEPPPRRTGRR